MQISDNQNHKDILVMKFKKKKTFVLLKEHSNMNNSGNIHQANKHINKATTNEETIRQMQKDTNKKSKKQKTKKQNLTK